MRQEDVLDIKATYEDETGRFDIVGFLDELLDWRNSSGREGSVLDTVFDVFVQYLY